MIIMFKFKGKTVEVLGIELNEFDCEELARRFADAARQIRNYYPPVAPTSQEGIKDE